MSDGEIELTDEEKIMIKYLSKEDKEKFLASKKKPVKQPAKSYIYKCSKCGSTFESKIELANNYGTVDKCPACSKKLKTKVITKTEKIPREIEFLIFEFYKSYKSRWSYNEDPKKNRRTNPKQQNINKLNEYFKFESKEEALK